MIEACWHKRQVGIAFRLCICDNGKVTAKYFPKFHLNKTNITIKEREKSDSEEAKFFSINFYNFVLMSFDLETNLSDVLFS